MAAVPFMLQCDWPQIRTTTHISTQVIIWISAGRWWWRQECPWSESRVSPDKHQGLRDTPTPALATLTGSPHTVSLPRYAVIKHRMSERREKKKWGRCKPRGWCKCCSTVKACCTCCTSIGVKWFLTNGTNSVDGSKVQNLDNHDGKCFKMGT